MVDYKETLIGIAKALVDSPDDVIVTCSEDERNINLVLSVASDDMGMIIGKQGRIAKAIRTIMKNAANSIGKRVTVDIK